MCVCKREKEKETRSEASTSIGHSLCKQQQFFITLSPLKAKNVYVCSCKGRSSFLRAPEDNNLMSAPALLSITMHMTHIPRRNTKQADLQRGPSSQEEHLHDALKLLIHLFGRLLVELCNEFVRHEVLARRELAEQPLSALVPQHHRRGGLEHQDSQAVELEARVLEPWEPDNTNINGNVSNVARAAEPVCKTFDVAPLGSKDLRDEIRVNLQGIPNLLVMDDLLYEFLGLNHFLAVRIAGECCVDVSIVSDVLRIKPVLLDTRAKQYTKLHNIRARYMV